MVKIKVTPELLRDVARQVWRVSDTLARVEGNLNRADNYLDAGELEGNVRWRVENSIGRATSKVRQIESETNELARELERIAGNFEQADGQSLGAGLRSLSSAIAGEYVGLLGSAVGLGGLYAEMDQLASLAGDITSMSPEELEQAAIRWIATSPANPLNGLSGSGEFAVEGAVVAGTLTGVAGTLVYSALGASARGSGSYEITDGILTAKGELHAEAHLASFEYDANLAGVEITADGWVGAEADARGELVFDPLSGSMVATASVSAFAGVRAGAEAQVDLGVVDATAHAGVRAGIGFEATGEASFEDGDLSVKFNVGAALGVGFDVGLDVTLDLGETVDTVVDVGNAVIDVFDNFF